MIRRVALLFVAAGLAGCAHDAGPYPSLAPRPVEKVTFDEPVRPHPAATPDAALDATIAARATELDHIVAGFDTAARAAERGLASGAARTVGSDAWLDAQAALARLDDWRAQESALTAEVEALGSDRAERLQPAYPALDALAERAAAESDRGARTTADLQKRLPAA